MSAAAGSKLVRVGTAGLLVATATWLGTTSASASVVGSGGCGGVADAVYYNVPSGSWRTLNLSNGVVEVEFTGNYSGINVEYAKTGGSTITADFDAWPFDTYKVSDNGSFTESAGQLKSFEWNNLGLLTGTCTVAGIDVVGQGYFTISISSS